ncbi:hypothetical protein [Deinococcus sp. Leaf326]|jgi:hypothetical protein|uniref:hypothetical protein n=1 Tax=Deinococcus sp. Leaf326 TaxID=1736338 RepID=UPI0007021376|nr:hypothetical protein [Deinococcus sp. Leaf326]KQR15467.1 hypothetical protein ASF71_20455 [Deinococcus sp. Leaf326]
MQLNQPVLFDAATVTAWTAYQAFVGRLVETQQVTHEVGERLCGILGRDKWHQGYRREQTGARTEPTRVAV